MPLESQQRIPGLDGLRAIAIGLVLVGHSLGTRHLPFNRRLVSCGELGVLIFFVISGYLITTLLLREREASGRISLRNFYVRRVFRIFPAFYVYLAVIVVAAALGGIQVGGKDLFYGAAYLMDFHAQKAWQVGHLWSLAVEEQFYLLWPFVLVVLARRHALGFALAQVALAPILRLMAWYWWPAAQPFTDRAFPFVFDALAVGCVLALARRRLETVGWYAAILDSPFFWLIPIAGLLSENHAPLFDLALKPAVVAIAAAMVIHRVCLRQPASGATRCLEWPPLAWIGTISYSLYLWQQPFLNRIEGAWYAAFPLNLGLAFAAACVSYYLIERPVLRRRARFVPDAGGAPDPRWSGMR